VLAQHAVDPGKVTAIARGLDLQRFDPAAVGAERLQRLKDAWDLKDDGRVRLLLAGRLTRWKGQALAIDALARLKAQGAPPVLLLLAGDNQGRTAYQAELETAARDAGLEDQVRIVGHCADMPAAYLLADIAIAPSLDPEAFGRTAVEPQAMGRPVIAADHGATRETVDPGVTGWLVRPGDGAAWAQAIGEALALGREQRDAMGRAALQRARRLYSVDAMCAATLAVYRDVLGGRS
jgi:glycosyltransferase involved in cell wall biosynthesis